MFFFRLVYSLSRPFVSRVAKMEFFVAHVLCVRKVSYTYALTTHVLV